MSEPTLPNPPHPPRWSKTAAIVVTVVFTLVVVVALFGLWAFKERKDADDERRHTSALDFAGHVLDDVYGTTRQTLSAALRNAARASDAESLRGVLKDEPALVRHLCRFDGREYFWIDGSLLHTPLALRAGWADAARADVQRANRDAGLLGAGFEGGALARLEGWTNVVLDYVMVSKSLKGEAFAVPLSLHYAKAMLDAAQGVAADTPEGRRALRDALVAALTAEELNRARTDLEAADRDLLLKQIREGMAATRARLPADEPPYAAWEVDQFEALRDLLADADARVPMENAIRAARVSGSFPAPGRVQLHHVAPHLVAVVADVETSVLTALQLDLDAVKAFVTAEINQPRWATPGFELRLKTDGTENSPVPEKPLADLEAQWNLPLTVVAVETPGPLFGTATDWFYWGIIALACVGIAIGGWVLVRLLTRQVRLAELKADFVSNLSHELKTPITSIGLFAEMLRDGKLVDADDRAEAYAVISLESDRLKHTVARMLRIARRAASRSPYRMRPGDLNEPTRKAVERFRRLVTDPGLTLAVELSPKPLPMTLDAESLEDVATNLLTNAWKYRRGDESHIRVRTMRRRGRAVLEVSDDGVGVPRRERRRIFQMFYRSEQYLSQGVSGTGLGLALVKTVVRGHRGRIRVLDGPGGQGSTFEATFPLASHDPGVTDEPSAPRSDGQTRVSRDPADRRSKQPSEHRRTSGPAAEHS